MKAVLVNPGWNGIVSRRGRRFNRKWPPLCLLNCASVLEREGIRAEIIDLRAERLKIPDVIKRISDADKVFVTTSAIDRWQCPDIDLDGFLGLIKPLRKDNLYVMGAHGTMSPEKILKDTGAKAVIRGEPEMAVSDLCKTDDLAKVAGISYIRNSRITNNPERPLIDMAELPLPAYHLIDLGKYEYELLGRRLALLEASRGCPFSCSYCYQGMYGWRQYRKKPVEKVNQEIDYIAAAGARSLYFIDLEFTLDKGFVHSICDHMIANRHNLMWCCQTRADTVDMDLLKKMRRAGCRLIHYGVETGSERVMEIINKKISLSDIGAGVAMTAEAGIETACFFMFGFPGETAKDMEETIRFALKINPSYASFHIATPYMGTELYRMGGADEPFPEAYTKEHSLDVLKELAQKALKRFYMRPSYVLSSLSKGKPALWMKQLRLFMGFIR